MELEIISPTLGSHIVHYDTDDFDIVNSRNWHIVKRGKVFYAANNDWTNRKLIYMHRFITGFSMTDHKDGNGLNNQRNNLRRTSKAQNAMNRGMTKKNTTGFKGVTIDKRTGKFQVGVNKKITGKRKYLFGGYFDTAIEAAKRYNELALIHHGEFAKLNIIP